jgi:Na+-transporting methylmalonyl-CoA/oxaloacetate decarboxylase gamma subunit
MSYTDIIKKAYRITIEHKILWVFGLFLVGGFNLNYLHFQNIPLRQIGRQDFSSLFYFFQVHPGKLAAASSVLLVILILFLVVTNLAKVMLVFWVQEISENKFSEPAEKWQNSKKPLRPVIQVSLFTSIMILIVGCAFLLAPLLIENMNLRLLFWIAGVVVFLPVVFVISCINIFTKFFVVIFKLDFKKALDLGTDFFITNWSQILGLTVILMIIYSAGFSVGLAILEFAKILIKMLYSQSVFGLSQNSGMIIRVLAGLVLWLFMAGLNVFFNTALLLFFFKSTTQIRAESVAKEAIVAPAIIS